MSPAFLEEVKNHGVAAGFSSETGARKEADIGFIANPTDFPDVKYNKYRR